MPEPTHNPQLTAARALVEHLTQHPELPRLDWSISRTSDELTGYTTDGGRHAVETYSAALGGTLCEPYIAPRSGYVTHTLHLVWRGVPVAIVGWDKQDAYPELAKAGQVAA